MTATTDHIALSLKWFGRVAGGPLHRRVKVADVHWCLEGSEVGKEIGQAVAHKRPSRGMQRRLSPCLPSACVTCFPPAQVHILLGKAEHGSNWRGLFHGSMVSQRAVRDNPEFKGGPVGGAATWLPGPRPQARVSSLATAAACPLQTCWTCPWPSWRASAGTGWRPCCGATTTSGQVGAPAAIRTKRLSRGAPGS